MEYVHIRNLEKFHPGYKDRQLVWAKIYFSLVQGDPEFELIENEIDKWRFVAMICLELRAQKPLPNSDTYWQKQGFNLKKRPISLTLKMLQGFIETVTDSLRTLDNTVPQIREEEKREEKRVVTELPKQIDTNSVRAAWEMFKQHRKQIKKPMTALAEKMALKRLLEFSGESAERAVRVIENSIANGWQGLFALKEVGKPVNETPIQHGPRTGKMQSLAESLPCPDHPKTKKGKSGLCLACFPVCEKCNEQHLPEEACDEWKKRMPQLKEILE